MAAILRQILFLTGALFVSAAALANDPPRVEVRETREVRDVREARDLRDSVRRVERDTGGSVLRAERVHGREVNRVKVLTPEGRVRVVHENNNERSREVDRGPRRNPRARDD
jgi:hypothetical protein